MLINRCEDGMMYFPFTEPPRLTLQEARLKTLVLPDSRALQHVSAQKQSYL